MAKVTEQDLIKLGFVERFTFNKRKFFEIQFNNQLIGTLEIYVSFIDNTIKLWADTDCINITRELSHENLDLFIRFAKGEKI